MGFCPNILIVEDHKSYHKLYEYTLKEATECRIDFTTSGSEAISKLKTTDYDLMLLDYNLPDMHGDNVLTAAKQEGSHLRIIILTGEDDPELQTKLLNLGADDFIEKGSSPEILIARVMVQLRHKISLDRAMELAMEVDSFTSGVLHDIRNIENSIASVCYLTEMLYEEDPIANRIPILENLNRLKTKAGSISTYASEIIEKVRQANGEAQREELKVKDLIEELDPLLAAKSSQHPYKIIIHPENLTVQADRHFLKLALLNIIQNSIKYTPETRSTIIDVSLEEQEDAVVLKLRDNGSGISKTELTKVFKPFVRGKDAHKSKVDGFGLGLSMVTRALHKMKGKVWAELPTDDGPGTILCLRLPKR